MTKLQPEDGNTQNSIDNIDALVTEHGQPRFLIQHIPVDIKVGDMTFFVFRDGYNHTATGFPTSFGKEERHGLMRTIQKHLFRYDITQWHIKSWTRGSDIMILVGQGIGEEIHNFALGEKRVEVW